MPAKPCTIDANKLYTIRACQLECGLSRRQIMQGRQAGKLKPKSCGRFRFYKGSELIEWVLAGK